VVEEGRWVTAPAEDVNEDFVELKGEVEHLPDATHIERAFTAVGFSCVQSKRRDVLEYYGRRGMERLTCWLGRRPTMRVQWESHRWPPVIGGEVEWSDRKWPAFFDEPRVYHRSRDMLMLMGKLPEAGFGPLVERYRNWSVEAEFERDEPYEPDITGALNARPPSRHALARSPTARDVRHTCRSPRIR
jgi:hypothetical protein